MPQERPAQGPSPGGWRSMLRSLRHRNFRLFFIGQLISLVGTWMQQVAMGWLVYRLTGSPLILGLITFCAQIPTLVLAPLAGVVADHYNRHRILLATQTLAMIQAFVVAALVLTHVVDHRVWLLVPLSLFIGCVNAFDVPARQSFFVHMIEDRNDLSNAIALNSSIVNGARLVGPSVAGALIAFFGEGWCFLLNGLSYLAVLWALLAMRLPAVKLAQRELNILREIREGFVYSFGFPPARYILLLLATGSLVGVPYAVLMPVVARDLLHGGPRTLGFLLGATGLGAFMGAVFLAARRSVLGLGRAVALSAVLFGLGLIAFSFSRSLWLSLPVLVLIGFGMITVLAGSNTILQTMVSDEMRGRIMSAFTMCFMGVMPFGSLLAGSMASHLGVPWTIRGGGVLMVAGAVLFAARLGRVRELLRPIYREKGILPAENPEPLGVK